MRQNMLRLSALLLCALGLTAAYHKTKPSAVMAGAAHNFLAALSPDQQAKATFQMSDNEQRTDWHYIPRPRKGIPLKDLDGAQRALAEGLLNSGLSQRGYMKATSIMSLEKVLKEIEPPGGRNVRDPELYYFSIFGEPSDTNTWGWRVEGHHLSLNFTIAKGQMVATSPSFFGDNPAEVKQGPRRGLRVLSREEDLGRELLMSLDAKQKTVAVIDPKAPADIVNTNKRKLEFETPKGIAGSKLTKKQVETLMALLDEYAGNMPEELANARMDLVRKAGLEKVFFAWAGGPDRGQGHYYRVQGPTFLVEYDNTQNDANHIHSVWRDYNGDFGADLLAMHYQRSHVKAAD